MIFTVVFQHGIILHFFLKYVNDYCLFQIPFSAYWDSVLLLQCFDFKKRDCLHIQHV